MLCCHFLLFLFSQSLLLLSPVRSQGAPYPASSYWLANIPRQGKVAFGDSTYPVYRNVKDPMFGAVGDGLTDDTAAINAAISYGNRCGGGDANGGYCDSSTTTPALVYLPPGTYKVSTSIVMYYFTQLVGDAVNPPTIKVSSDWTPGVGLAVLDADIYIPNANGKEWYTNTNNFYRQVRNLIIDMTEAPLIVYTSQGPTTMNGIHWQVAQATSLQNIVIRMQPSNVANNAQVGIQMENGSGGFFSDVTVIGGSIGMYLGNQQFTTRKLTITGSSTAIQMNFDWLWTFSQLLITDCAVGIDMSKGGFSSQTTGSVVVFDSSISATQGILSPYVPGYSSPQSAGTLVLERVDFNGSGNALAVAQGSNARVIIPGDPYIELFAQGNAWTNAGQALNGQSYNGTACIVANASQTAYTAQETTIQEQLAPVVRPSSLVDNTTGDYIYRVKPQYEGEPVSAFYSAKSNGCVGDGVADDTECVQNTMYLAGNNSGIAYFDHGAYLIYNTIFVPPNVKITGECLPIIMATGNTFSDQLNPQPMWQIGNPGDVGTVEISDIVFEVKGPAPGAILVQWNIQQDGGGMAGMWDAHWRIGGSAGTGLQMDTCQLQPNITTTLAGTAVCQGAFMLLHVTPQANIYMENTWGWVADHELDMGNRSQIDIYNGRGFFIESANGPVWMYGTAAEHSVLYDYQWAHASNIYAGHVQHETAYYQGNPNALVPFTPQEAYTDPTFSNCEQNNCARTWGMRFVNVSEARIYSAGLYNFYDNWGQTCLSDDSCQQHIVDISNSSEIYIWALNTVGTQNMIQYEGYDVVPYSANVGTFCDCIALFELATTP